MNIMSFPRKRTLSFPRKRESKKSRHVPTKVGIPIFMGMTMVFALILSQSLAVGVRAEEVLLPIKWRIEPETTAENPHIRDWTLLEITTPVPDAKYYKLEKLKDKEGTKVIEENGFPRIFDNLKHVFRITPNTWADMSAEDGPIYFRVSAWSDKEKYGGVRISEYSEVLEVHYDHRFESLKLEAQVTELGPGDFLLRFVPEPDQPQELLEQIEHYSWGYCTPVLDADGNIELDEYGRLKFDKNSWLRTAKPETRVSFSEPGLKYVGFYGAWNGSHGWTNNAYTGAGILSRPGPNSPVMALIVQPEDDTAEPFDTPPNFNGIKYIHSKKIPGDIKFALIKDNISLFNGGSVCMPLRGANPGFAEVELPKGIELVDGSSVYTLRDISGEVADGTLEEGYQRFKITKDNPNANWCYLNRVLSLHFKFTSKDVIGKGNLHMRLRLYNKEEDGQRTDNWQTIGITCEEIPEVTLPKRLKTGITWAGTGIFVKADSDPDLNFFSIYKKLGFNTVPRTATNWSDPEEKPETYYFPEDRKGPEWEGLFYGPEHSTFYKGYHGTGLFGRLKQKVEDVDKFDFSKYGLTPEEIEIEKGKWRNALEYYALPETGHMDMAYDGIFLKRDLDNLSKVLKAIKPDYIFIDSECFPHRGHWIKHASKSKNAERRRKPGERDEELACRITDEFLTRFANTVLDASPNTKIAFYATSSLYNYGYKTFTWELFEKHGIVTQPSVYEICHILNRYAEFMRLNREGLLKGYELMPWITTGTWGEMDPEYVFDIVTHTFLSGSTGFSVYSYTDFDDMADYLYMARAIACVSPYEDIVMDGDIAYDDTTGVENAVVSAMELNGEYLIAVSPKDTDAQVSFSLNTGSPDKHVLYDVRHDIVTTFESGDISYNDTPGESTVFHLTTDLEKYADLIEGDVNNDGKVDIRDLALVAGAFGSTAENPNWNARADMNEDGIVDISDLVCVARNFGEGV